LLVVKSSGEKLRTIWNRRGNANGALEIEQERKRISEERGGGMRTTLEEGLSQGNVLAMRRWRARQKRRVLSKKGSDRKRSSSQSKTCEQHLSRKKKFDGAGAGRCTRRRRLQTPSGKETPVAKRHMGGGGPGLKGALREVC